jgi:hypothetical protein
VITSEVIALIIALCQDCGIELRLANNVYINTDFHHPIVRSQNIVSAAGNRRFDRALVLVTPRSNGNLITNIILSTRIRQ